MEQLEQLPIPLLIWFGEHARKLPWRENPTAYRVWVSEIMLQQTRVVAVLDYYRRFLDELPDVQSLASCDPERLMKLWQGLGYYSRGRNLQRAAQQIMTDFGGEFPEQYEEIRSLAGVGDYTAGAISSIAFGLPRPAVDGNVLRVVARITGDDGDITTPAMKKRVTAALAEVMPLGQAGNFNQGLMELGATVCLPNGAPLCDRCPAQEFCVAKRMERTGELPVKAPKKARKIENRAVYYLFCGDCVAIRQRPSKGLLAGLWEFPHWLEGEMIPRYAAQRAATGKHMFTHIEWKMTAYIGEITAEELPDGWVLASRNDLTNRYAVPNAFQCFQHILEENLR